MTITQEQKNNLLEENPPGIFCLLTYPTAALFGAVLSTREDVSSILLQACSTFTFHYCSN